MAEIQAAAESYSAEYLAAERKMIQILVSLEIAQDNLGRFNTINCKYEKDLKKNAADFYQRKFVPQWKLN
jgi:hypothetical protein